jgi:HTH-type transcriptional regulator/antitoxin HipB
MGASRFWVAEFEAGKPRAEIGLVLKAIHAVGLGLTIGPENHDPARRDKGIPAIAPALPPAIDLAASLEAASTPVRRE